MFRIYDAHKTLCNYSYVCGMQVLRDVDEVALYPWDTSLQHLRTCKPPPSITLLPQHWSATCQRHVAVMTRLEGKFSFSVVEPRLWYRSALEPFQSNLRKFGCGL